jgi:hypothetical protein
MHTEALPFLYAQSKLIIHHHNGSILVFLPNGPELPPFVPEFKNLRLCKSIEWPLDGIRLDWARIDPESLNGPHGIFHWSEPLSF